MGLFKFNLPGLWNKPKVTSNSPTKEFGFPGTEVYGGFIETTEKNPNLVGDRKWRTYSEMIANIPTIGGGLRHFSYTLAHANWNVIPKDDSAEAKEIAEFVEKNLHGMSDSWSSIIRKAGRYIFMGVMVFEWSMEIREGKYHLASLKPRPAHTIEQWDVDIHGNLKGIVQEHPTYGSERIYLTRDKLVYLVDDTLRDSPEGLGMLRHVASAAERYTRKVELESIGFESDLRGVPVGYAPLAELHEMVSTGEITEADYKNATKSITSWVRNRIKAANSGLIMDSSTYRAGGDNETPSAVKKWEVKLLQHFSQTQNEVNNSIEREIREIARCLNVEHILLGDNDRGSFALSSNKTAVFFLLIETVLNYIAETMQRDLVDKLLVLNGYDKKLRPDLKPELTSFKDPQVSVGIIRDLAQAGIMLDGDEEPIGQIFDQVGLKRPKDPTRREDGQDDLMDDNPTQKEPEDNGDRNDQ